VRKLIAFIGIAAVVACHHTIAGLSDTVAPCIALYPVPPAGTIRIDGPGSFAPHVGDSLIVRVDNSERWRGALPSCVRATLGLSIDISPWQAAGDSLDVIALDQTSGSRRPAVWELQLVTRRKKQD
jgi:hypothetical protein